jgi:hypothetical protein
MREKTIRVVLGAVMAAVLAFGTREALASVPASAPASPACDEQKCDYYCITHGANYGFCLNGTCVCRSGP